MKPPSDTEVKGADFGRTSHGAFHSAALKEAGFVCEMAIEHKCVSIVVSATIPSDPSFS
jgi:hypothetical protein